MREAKNTGEQGTFVVRILNQQNATWQGTITRVGDEREEQYLRCLLELIELIDSAISDF
jgi:hypothetical protein